MIMPGYPAGVPNPLHKHTHPYPTRYHGTIYTRPVYTLPFSENPHAVPMPRDFAGFGSVALGDYEVGRGIFRPGGYGGGVFDGNIAGLGRALGEAYSALGDAVADCLSSNCNNPNAPLAPDQRSACVAACNQLKVVPKTSTVGPPPVIVSPKSTSSETLTQASLYSGSSDNKWLAFAVGGALALGVLVYMKKKKKKG